MIQVDRLNLSVGSFALRDVSLEVGEGEYFVLLGASGSGKTLLLESLCGLHRIDSGRIVIAGVDVTREEPLCRRIGYLPQDYALFPHLPVRYNVGFGLVNPVGVALGFAQQPIEHLLRMAGISELADRLPANLSGGEKQRVALARALAVRPQLLLLDEPVSALDERTRDQLCRQLKRLQRETSTTTIHVCHNFTEMLAVADRAGVIHNGRIVQVGQPAEVLGRPDTPTIAQFVQAENLFTARATVDGDWIRLSCSGGVEFLATHAGPVGSTARFMVRPENVYLGTEPAEDMPPGTTSLEGRVSEVMQAGPLVHVTVIAAGDMQLLVSLGKKEYRSCRPDVGTRVYLAVRPEDVHVWQ